MSSPIRRRARPPRMVASYAAWDTMYDKLVQFHRKHGHCRIPHHNQNLRKLYRWATRQRLNAAARLSEQRRARLDAVGYDWTPQDQTRDSRWNEMFERLEAYKDKHENCLVSAGYEDQQLMEWVKKQRYHYLREEMPDNRVRRLESLGFDWKPGAPRVGDEGGGRQRGSVGDMAEQEPTSAAAAAACRLEDEGLDHSRSDWDDKYIKLASFYRKHRSYNSLKSHCNELATWVTLQTARLSQGALSEERRRKLDKIKLSEELYETKMDHVWNGMFNQLKLYKQQHGHCLVPWSTGCSKLYNWVAWQRRMKTVGSLLKTRKDRLDSVGFCWDTSEASEDTSQPQRRDPAPARGRVIAPIAPYGGQTSWDVMYEKLVRYYRTYGKCNVAKTCSADLHNRILEQRLTNANNELSADKRLKLDQIHFAWMGKDKKEEELWNKMFESLKAYKAANGDCLVLRSYCEDLKLYHWVRSQLSRNKRGKLPRHRWDRLQGIGFCWDANPNPKGAKQAPSLALQEAQPNPSAGNPTSVSLPSSNGQQPVQRWNLQLERLKIYQAWYGDCLVPTSYDKGLAEWVSSQHNLHKLNKLREPRYGKLERIGFFSDAESEKALNGGTKRRASPGDPLESEDQSFSGAKDLPDRTNNVGSANPESCAELSRSPKRARIDGSTALAASD